MEVLLRMKELRGKCGNVIGFDKHPRIDHWGIPEWKQGYCDECNPANFMYRYVEGVDPKTGKPVND
jgi:hypothetical protein